MNSSRLDEEGNPRRKSAKPGRPRPAAAVRKKPPPRRRPPVLPPSVAATTTEEVVLDADLDEGTETPEAAAPMGLKRRAAPTPVRRPRTGNGA